jgi:hypothetical protein
MHPLAHRNPVPIRFVTGVYEDMQLGIEEGAAFDAGEMATFAAIPQGAGDPHHRRQTSAAGSAAY